MTKGVAKNIIEIRSHENDYFEKLIVILKNDNCISEDELEKYAYLAAGKKPDFLSHRKSLLPEMLLCSAIGAFSAIICCCVFFLFV